MGEGEGEGEGRGEMRLRFPPRRPVGIVQFEGRHGDDRVDSESQPGKKNENG